MYKEESFDTKHLICKYPILIPNSSYVKIFILFVVPKTFLNIFQNSFRNELHASFLPYYDTQHLIYKNSYFVRRGVPWYLKIISTRVYKKIFLIKAKILFCTGCPKSWLKIFIFEYFPKFLQKWTPRTLFTLFWYQTLHIWNFHFSPFWL